MKPFELKAMTYEEARREHFTLLMKKAKRKMDYWSARLDKTRPDNLMDEAHIKASDAGWEYNFYKDALEALESLPEWISVEERLPDERGRYLTVIRCSKGIWIEVNNYDHLEELWEHDMDGYSEDATEYVTHWMPLPSCSKEVK